MKQAQYGVAAFGAVKSRDEELTVGCCDVRDLPEQNPQVRHALDVLGVNLDAASATMEHLALRLGPVLNGETLGPRVNRLSEVALCPLALEITCKAGSVDDLIAKMQDVIDRLEL